MHSLYFKQQELYCRQKQNGPSKIFGSCVFTVRLCDSINISKNKLKLLFINEMKVSPLNFSSFQFTHLKGRKPTDGIASSGLLQFFCGTCATANYEKKQ